MPVLIALRFELPQNSLDDEERAYLISTMDLYEQWERQTKAEGLKQGLRQGHEQGQKQGLKQGRQQRRKQGLEQGPKKALIAAYRARFGALPPNIAAAIETTHDTSVLNIRLERIVTGTPEEVAATLRSPSTPPP
jgi:flagellar biosynthesis/type III secretory pathway protein FliH